MKDAIVGRLDNIITDERINNDCTSSCDGAQLLNLVR
jgi:hypothetical protein